MIAIVQITDDDIWFYIQVIHSIMHHTQITLLWHLRKRDIVLGWVDTQGTNIEEDIRGICCLHLQDRSVNHVWKHESDTGNWEQELEQWGRWRWQFIWFYLYSKTNQMHQCIKFVFFWNDTLHVSNGLPIHHQQFKTVHTATGICQTDTAVCLLGSRQQYLMMDWKTVQNM